MNTPTQRRRLLPRWRFMTWLFFAFNILMLVWLVGGVSSADNDGTSCESLDAETCKAAEDVGTAIGAGLVIALWVAGVIILGILWLVTRPSRHCPACGRGARRGHLNCRDCGYDFAAAARQQQFAPYPPPQAPPAPPQQPQ